MDDKSIEKPIPNMSMWTNNFGVDCFQNSQQLIVKSIVKLSLLVDSVD